MLDLTGMPSLAGVVGGLAEQAERLPAQDVLFGFDAAVQFSRRLLEVQLSASLAKQNLSPLSASVPWGTLAVPRSLLDRLLILNTVSVRESRLELRLVRPQIAAMNWPADADVTGSGPVNTRRRIETRPTARMVAVAWRLELSVLTARFDLAVGTLASVSPTVGSSAANINTDLANSVDLGPPNDGASWNRSTFAVGRFVLEAEAQLVSEPHLWRFGVELEFTSGTPTVTSEEAALVDFVAGAGQGLLLSLIARLQAAGVRLTPHVAPAGALSARSVQRHSLPGFTVYDRLLSDRHGDPVLSLVLQREGSSGGVTRLLKPFLEISDFAYAVSTSILEPALKVRWKRYAAGASFAGETSFEGGLNEDGADTEHLRAQMTVRFGDALDIVTLRSAGGSQGDGLLLVGRQTIQLLNIWRENNDRIEDLGQLGRPADLPLAMLLYLLDKSSAADVRGDIRELLMKLLIVVPYPLLQLFAANPASISGFISSPLKTVMTRWRLKTVFDDVATDVRNPVVLGSS